MADIELPDFDSVSDDQNHKVGASTLPKYSKSNQTAGTQWDSRDEFQGLSFAAGDQPFYF